MRNCSLCCVRSRAVPDPILVLYHPSWLVSTAAVQYSTNTKTFYVYVLGICSRLLSKNLKL
jgi:hypothetical protein